MLGTLNIKCSLIDKRKTATNVLISQSRHRCFGGAWNCRPEDTSDGTASRARRAEQEGALLRANLPSALGTTLATRTSRGDFIVDQLGLVYLSSDLEKQHEDDDGQKDGQSNQEYLDPI